MDKESKEIRSEEKKKKIKSGNMKKIIGILLAGATVLSAGALIRKNIEVQQYEAKASEGYCTVLVYMDGSDLESDYNAASDDLLEMEQAMEDAGLKKEDVHIVVEAGGSESWTYHAMKNKKYGRFCISAEGPVDVEEMESRNMGEANTLTDFINYGTQSYPAKHYGMIFWNHGAGQIAGFGSDSLFDDDSLSLHEIKEAMENSAMKDDVFSFISLDACLMGTMELAEALQDKAEYFIASEELEPQFGYDYRWLEAIRKEMDKNINLQNIGRAVGEEMVRTYGEYYEKDTYKLTLSLLDLKEYEDFYACFSKMMERVRERADAALYRELGKKRQTLQSFGGTGSYGEILDLMDCMELFAELTDDKASYEQLQKLYGKLVSEKVTKGYEEEPSGLSLYLPSGSNEWIMQDMQIYSTIGFCDAYELFLEGYQSYLATESHITWQTVDKKEQEITVRVDKDTMDDIAKAYLAVFGDTGKEGEVYLLSTDSDVVYDRAGYLKAKEEEQYWGLGDEVLCLIEAIDTDSYTEYIAPILYNNELCVMHIAFSEDDENGAITAIVPVGTKKQEYVLKDGDIVYPLYPLEQAEDGNAWIPAPDKRQDKTEAHPAEAGARAESGDIYMDSYYVGNAIVIKDVENGDAKLRLIKVDTKKCMFGFMLWDSRQRLYYTDFIASPSS